MKYIYGIMCWILWLLFMLEKIPLENQNQVFALVFILLAIIFTTYKREGD